MKIGFPAPAILIGLAMALPGSLSAQIPEDPAAAQSSEAARSSPLDPPDVLDELESLEIGELPEPWIEDTASLADSAGRPREAGSAPVGAGPEGMSINTWWLTPPAWNAVDSSTRIPDQAIERWQAEEPKLPALTPPETVAPDSGTPEEAVAFPPPGLGDIPLENLSLPPLVGAKRGLRVGGTRVRYGAQVDAGLSYTDNVFGTKDNPQSDFIFTLQPAVVIEAGNRSTVRVIYAPGIVKYGRFKQFDTVNQNFLFSSRLRMSKLEVGLDAGYLTQSGLFLGSDGQARQETLQARLFANYRLTAKTRLVSTLEWSRRSSDPGGIQQGLNFGMAVDYRYSRKTSFGGAFTAGHYVLPAGSTTYLDLLLRLRYSPTPKLILTAEGGYQFRRSVTDGGTFASATSIVNAKLAWLVTRKTTLALRLFRNVAVDPFTPDTLQTLTGGELEWTWQVFPKAKLEAAIASAYAQNSSLSGQEGDSYFFNTGRVAFIYVPRDGVNMRVFTGVQQRLGDQDSEGDYTATLSGMAMGVGF